MARSRGYGNSLFTRRQYEIMRLRKDGLSQEQIAKELGVTRQNISILERRTHENMEKAMNTLNLAFEMDFLYRVSIDAGMNILEASNRIFSEADRAGVKLKESYLSMAMLLRSSAASSIQHGKLSAKMVAYLRKNGRITILFDR